MENQQTTQGKKLKDIIYCCTLCDNEKFNGFEESQRHALKHVNVLNDPAKADKSVFKKLKRGGDEVDHENKEIPHVCSMCSKTYKNKTLLKKHEALHFNENILLDDLEMNKVKPHVCWMCNKAYKHKSLLRKHEALHFESDTDILLDDANMDKGSHHICSMCDTVYKTKSALKKHEAFHFDNNKKVALDDFSMNKEKPHICLTCGKAYKYESSLKNHEFLHKNKIVKKKRKKSHSKDICEDSNSDVIKSPEAVLKYKPQVPEEFCTCDICGKKYTSIYSMEIHRNIHTQKKVHRCNVCQKTFTLATTLKQHYFVHNKEEKPYRCTVCGLAFVKRYPLNRHMQLHAGVLPYKCDHCSKAYTTKAALKYHMINHDGIYPLKCNKCDKGFRQTKYLDAHLKVCGEDKPRVIGIKGSRKKMFLSSFPCKFCNKVFKTEGRLDIHLSGHSGTYRFYCQVCEMGFTQKHNYAEHMKTHRNDGEMESKRVCKICGKAFSKPYYMKEHYRRMHTGDLPFECGYCDKKFNAKANRDQHVTYIHTRDFQFQCSLCDKGFTLKYKYERHIRAKHSIKKKKNSKGSCSADDESA